MSNIAEMPRATVPAVNEQQMLDVLRSSLYPGAADASIKLVLSYCKAAGLDPMAKPVHIVPMYDKKLGGMRDVVMPGIDLYRTKAARTGYYAGCSEPEFGPDVTQNLGGAEVTFPAWCRVTVRRIVPQSRAIDTLEISRRTHPGAKHTLDALCSRYGIDLSARTKHGALIDAELLARVYIELTGGRQIGFDLASTAPGAQTTPERVSLAARDHCASPEELAAHAAFVAGLKDPLWLS